MNERLWMYRVLQSQCRQFLFDRKPSQMAPEGWKDRKEYRYDSKVQSEFGRRVARSLKRHSSTKQRHRLGHSHKMFRRRQRSPTHQRLAGRQRADSTSPDSTETSYPESTLTIVS